MGDAPYFEKHRQMVNYVLEQTDGPGLYLEFGVGRGKSMRWISSKIKDVIHGFDSFDGIQEHWNGNPIGAFAQKHPPKFKSNVKLYVGYFNDTLKDFLKTNSGSVAFLHIDCDLYSSTATIFDLLGNRLRPGSIILFDEYYGFPNWEKYEYKALQEILKKDNYKYIAFGTRQACIEII